jgi:hypothetical protein
MLHWQLDYAAERLVAMVEWLRWRVVSIRMWNLLLVDASDDDAQQKCLEGGIRNRLHDP